MLLYSSHWAVVTTVDVMLGHFHLINSYSTIDACFKVAIVALNSISGQC